VQVALGDDVVATPVAPSALPEFPMGARIEVPYTRAIVAYWRPAALDAVAGVWTVAFPAPNDALVVGEYQLVWRDSGPEPPELEVFIPLAVARGAAVAVAPGEAAPWAPTVLDVAKVTPAYTEGGTDDDRDPEAILPVAGGAPQGTYTDNTVPTAADVQALIQAAVDEVQGRVGVAIPEAHYGLAKVTAKWHAAAAIAASKQPANTDDATGEYRGHITNFRNSLDALITLARMGGTRLH
jgi:hypothetical protein